MMWENMKYTGGEKEPDENQEMYALTVFIFRAALISSQQNSVDRADYLSIPSLNIYVRVLTY